MCLPLFHAEGHPGHPPSVHQLPMSGHCKPTVLRQCSMLVGMQILIIANR
jgi:hypothetical protein